MLRQEQKAGEKVFVDYAGQTIPVVDRSTGETVRLRVRGSDKMSSRSMLTPGHHGRQ